MSRKLLVCIVWCLSVAVCEAIGCKNGEKPPPAVHDAREQDDTKPAVSPRTKQRVNAEDARRPQEGTGEKPAIPVNKAAGIGSPRTSGTRPAPAKYSRPSARHARPAPRSDRRKPERVKLPADLKTKQPALFELASALNDESEVSIVREYAALLIGEMGKTAAPVVPVLVGALDQGDPYVRRTVARALGRIGPAAKAAVPDLTSLANADIDWRRRISGDLGIEGIALALILTGDATRTDAGIKMKAAEADANYGIKILDEKQRVRPAKYFEYRGVEWAEKTGVMGLNIERYKLPKQAGTREYDMDLLRHASRLQELRVFDGKIAEVGRPDHFKDYRAAERKDCAMLKKVVGWYALKTSARGQGRLCAQWDAKTAAEEAVLKIVGRRAPSKTTSRKTHEDPAAPVHRK